MDYYLKESEREPLLYPPGGILIWMVLSLELLTFIPALIAFFYYRQAAPDSFAQSASQLNLEIATINTALLIVGGWFVARALHALRQRQNLQARSFLGGGLLSGLLFLALKGYEYAHKYSQGLDLAYNDFFTMYWLITGFHFLHVVVAALLLIVAMRGIARGRYNATNSEDVETIGVFWHMCDLIWILVFPSLYIFPLGGMQ
ncbi:MAG: cytochrome c oxidase subunit 3 [Leptospiraceae bacterium]|nr:cytochrome c oxidase subunit 3 [Leptospiraceae bacterium]MCB1169864.1 cytochrome c oxidase subunit 3 [Leptospiraceae bacterium]